MTKKIFYTKRVSPALCERVGYTELEIEEFRLKGEKISRIARIILKNGVLSTKDPSFLFSNI